MNKFERIQLLKTLGMNTEDSVLIASELDHEKHAAFLQRFSTYSVRTFRDEAYGRSHPHFPIIERAEFEMCYPSLLSQGLKLIIAAPIDPKDAELAGCLSYAEGRVLAEVALGPGTVRRVTGEGKIDLRVTSERAGHSVGDHRLDAAIVEVRKAVAMLDRSDASGIPDDVLFEFSWYRGCVGLLRERLIFWELVVPDERADRRGRRPEGRS